MRKLFFLLVLILASVASFGQKFENYLTPAGIAFDTAVNATPKYLISRNNPGFFDNVAIQVNIDRISGTAGGNLFLQGSLDNINWINVDTIAVTNVAAQSRLFIVESYPFAFLRVNFTGTGTMSARFTARSLYKKR